VDVLSEDQLSLRDPFYGRQNAWDESQVGLDGLVNRGEQRGAGRRLRHEDYFHSRATVAL
jgi:hypothetical protein